MLSLSQGADVQLALFIPRESEPLRADSDHKTSVLKYER